MLRCCKLLIGLAGAVLLMGCSSIPGGIAASNTPLNAKPYTIISPTHGADSRVAILGLIPITNGNSLKDAVEKAKTEVSADALIDITVDCYTQYWILFTRTVTVVDAKGIKFKGSWQGDAEVQR